MERSLAIKCPDIGTHLAGTKKVQQVLARPGVLERFFPDRPQVVQQIRDTFTGLYILDQVFRLTTRWWESQRNNFFAGDLVRVVEGDVGRAACILMNRIRPKVECNVLLKKDQPVEACGVAVELGVFGAFHRVGVSQSTASLRGCSSLTIIRLLFLTNSQEKLKYSFYKEPRTKHLNF
ncbi:Glutathione synthetase [Merluccius polli]|uniref:Glutathione synthetase n=1 Tax=Merluccius polli TaxID=89951 RepID=A0AA47NQX1_MERPO|nr:Glutathione synthetase [Merluccius polli]